MAFIYAAKIIHHQWAKVFSSHVLIYVPHILFMRLLDSQWGGGALITGSKINLLQFSYRMSPPLQLGDKKCSGPQYNVSFQTYQGLICQLSTSWHLPCVPDVRGRNQFNINSRGNNITNILNVSSKLNLNYKIVWIHFYKKIEDLNTSMKLHV